MKDAMKGVFPSSGPKALMRTKQDTQSFSLSFLYFSFLFSEDGVVPNVARSVCVVTMHPEKRFCVALFFLKHGNFPTFLGDDPNNLSCFWNWREGGRGRWKLQTPNATNLWWNDQFSPVYWIEWLWRSSFYLFLTLKLGEWVCFTLLNIST